MKADLCDGCASCPLASQESCAPPSGPKDARILVVGEAPGRQEAEQSRPFVGPSGTMLRSALAQFGVDPETEVRFLNTVQCRPPQNRDPHPIEQHLCTVLEDEMRAFRGDVILAVGKKAAERLLGLPYLRQLRNARSVWDGYAHLPAVLPSRVDLGHELYEGGEVYKSGKNKGKPKMSKRLLAAHNGSPENLRAVVACLHPSAVMRAGFSNKVQFSAAVQRACLVALGADVPSHDELAGVANTVEWPTDWKMPERSDVDLVFDIENTEEGLTDISFVEVANNGTICQRGSFSWTPATAGLTEKLLGAESPYRTLVAHNAAYDCGQLRAMADIGVRGSGLGERGEGLACTMMAAQLDQPDLAKGLSAMWRYLPPMPPWKHLSGANMRLYNLLDSVVTGMAWAQLRRRIAERGQRRLLQAEMASIMVLDRMTRRGLPVDVEKLKAWIAETEIEVARLRDRWTKLSGVAATSGKNALAKVFGENGWACPVQAETPTGQPKFDEDVIEALLKLDIHPDAREALETLLQWRKTNKLLTTYGTGFLERLGDDGRLHPSYLPNIKDSGDLGTAAGRLSSSPNVQNIPKGMRWVFVAPEGYVIGDSDLRAVEGRVQAVLADDQELLRIYDRPGFDMHRLNLRNAKRALLELWRETEDERTASGAPSSFSKLAKGRLAGYANGVWPIDRPNMKTFLYGWNYGSGDQTIAKSLGIHLREAAAIREAYERSRPATKRWRSAVVRSASRHKLLQNAFGRIRYFPGVVPDPNVRNQAINFFPQATVADMMWVWFPEIEEALARHDAGLITQVHDSFVWEGPASEAHAIVLELDRLMTREWPEIAPGFSVPATHDLGPSWGDMRPVKVKEISDAHMEERHSSREDR